MYKMSIQNKLGFESSIVEAMTTADREYTATLIDAYPPVDRSSKSLTGGRPGDYWGIATAAASAELGVPIGFERGDPETDGDSIVIVGSSRSINEWLNLACHESSTLHNAAHTESDSGLYTLLSNPIHGHLFEHVYAAYHGEDITNIIAADPMTPEIRAEQPATYLQIINHEGFMTMYQENPEDTIRMYLARQLPRLKHLRSTIEHSERNLSTEGLQITDGMDDHTKRIFTSILEKRLKHAPFERSRLERWQTEYDFTASLVMEGYKPYALPDVVPKVSAYVIALLATKPELSPTNPGAEIPDIKAGIQQMLAELEACQAEE